MTDNHLPDQISGPKDKRTLILEAAVAVFSHRGFHEAKVEEIAAQAGVGKGTVYEYFSSKRELFQEMIQTGLNFYSQHIYRMDTEEGGLREKIKRIFRLHLHFTLKYRNLAKIAFGDHTSVNDEMRLWLISLREEKVQVLSQTLSEGMQLGVVRAIDPKLTANILIGIMGGLCYPIVFGDEEVDVEGAAEMAVEMVFKGIGIN
jgi:TetR/AcrR family fatty acid metabolism transcriptional regulator